MIDNENHESEKLDDCQINSELNWVKKIEIDIRNKIFKRKNGNYQDDELKSLKNQSETKKES